MLTLGVDDLEKSLKFYRDGLGLRTDGVIGQEFEHGSTVLFHLEGGTLLALYARGDLGLDAGIEPTPRSPTLTSMPWARSSSGSPMPDSISSCGELMTPPHRITSRSARAMTVLPFRRCSTPPAPRRD